MITRTIEKEVSVKIELPEEMKIIANEKELERKRALEVIIMEIYNLSKERKIHPCGGRESVTCKRWYPRKILHDRMYSVRPPSRQYPYSYLIHCRTKKFIKRLLTHYKIRTLDDALNLYTNGVYSPISNAEDFILY